MPDYPTVKWEGLKITSHPVGWRFAIPVLRKALKRVPFFSGSKAVFCVHLEPDNKEKKMKNFEFRWFYMGPSAGGNPYDGAVNVAVNEPKKIKVWTQRMMGSGEGSIRFVNPRKSLNENGRYEDVIGFDVKHSDTLSMLVLNLTAAAVIATLAAGFGAWAGRNILQSDEPIPVRIIVEEPATQSETDNNEQ